MTEGPGWLRYATAHIRRLYLVIVAVMRCLQVYEAKVSQSPESHGSPSSPTFKARWASNARAPKGAKLCHEDFWPNCTNPNEPNLSDVEFETFE